MLPQRSLPDSGKRMRKPYTITKTRENWTEMEHGKFLEALHRFHRDWKKIEAFIGTKTVKQIRSHAQKHFLKVEKSGSGEHVPPPRPKRKAAHPYPQKATKAATSFSMQQYSNSTMSFSMLKADIESPSGSKNCTSFRSSSTPSPQFRHMMSSSHKDWPDKGTSSVTTIDSGICGSNNYRSPVPWNSGTNVREENQDMQIQASPDFAKIYKFLGDLFDLNLSDHLANLKEMSPVDQETTLALMKNLTESLPTYQFLENTLALMRNLTESLPTYQFPENGSN